MTLVHFESFHPKKVKIKKSSHVVQWIKTTIHSYHRNCGEILIVFCDDQCLLKMNQKYLKHNTLTDIITFNYNELEIISGEIYISLDRVKDNAQKYKVPLENELLRVIIHGVLHLIGFNDYTKREKSIIRLQEELALSKAPSISFMWNES